MRAFTGRLERGWKNGNGLQRKQLARALVHDANFILRPLGSDACPSSLRGEARCSDAVLRLGGFSRNCEACADHPYVHVPSQLHSCVLTPPELGQG